MAGFLDDSVNPVDDEEHFSFEYLALLTLSSLSRATYTQYLSPSAVSHVDAMCEHTTFEEALRSLIWYLPKYEIQGLETISAATASIDLVDPPFPYALKWSPVSKMPQVPLGSLPPLLPGHARLFHGTSISAAFDILLYGIHPPNYHRHDFFRGPAFYVTPQLFLVVSLPNVGRSSEIAMSFSCSTYPSLHPMLLPLLLLPAHAPSLEISDHASCVQWWQRVQLCQSYLSIDQASATFQQKGPANSTL